MNKLFLVCLVLGFFFVSTYHVRAGESGTLGDLSLEQLLNVEVTSVSKKSERAFDAAAAIHVITEEDIRRSGATNIPEALRLAPGVQVARVNSHSWAITIHGFAGGFANKLLVMIDGRSVYTPLFSGVIWTVQDTLLSDVKHIEVIRGSGGALWGANAVNGVINIITKRAAKTQGAHISALYGSGHIGHEEAVRYGGKINDNIFYRVYAKYFEKAATDTLAGVSNGDKWNVSRSGFRVDVENENGEIGFTLQGDVYAEDLHGVQTPISTSPTTIVHESNAGGGNLLARFNHAHDNQSESVLQLYFDNIRRDALLLEQQRNTYDVDYQNTWNYNSRNELVWGVGFRHVTSKLEGSTYFQFTPANRKLNLYSAFVQNKYAMIPEKLFLTLGSKFEHNEFTGFEYQPNIRVAWLPNEQQTLWAAISRAVRTPSIGENDILVVQRLSGIGSGFVFGQGNTNVDSEDLLAYELGYRIRPTKDTSFDVTAFFNDYENLVSLEPTVLSLPNVIIPISNSGEAQVYGAEIEANWDVNKYWRLSGAYSFLQMELNVDNLGTDQDEGKSPKNQLNLRSQLTLPYNLELDKSLYYVDNLNTSNIPGYVRADVRLGWKPKKGIQLDIVGQNLFDSSHPEFTPALHTAASEIGRTVYGRVTINF